MSEPAKPRSVGAVVNALSILRYLARSGTPTGVSAIARATGVTPSTTFNILRTLATERLVVFDTEAKTYRLGFGVVELAVGLLGTNHGDLIRPELERLALNSGALMCLWQVTDTNRVVLIDRVWDPDTIRVDLPLGKRLPSLIGAVGRAIAASGTLDEDDLRLRFARLRWQDPPGFQGYLDSVTQARATGYGLDLGNLFRGVNSVAAVVHDHAKKPRYGISGVVLGGQTSLEEMHRLGRELTEVAERIGAALFAARQRNIA